LSLRLVQASKLLPLAAAINQYWIVRSSVMLPVPSCWPLLLRLINIGLCSIIIFLIMSKLLTIAALLM
jgi:hypothetical protein